MRYNDSAQEAVQDFLASRPMQQFDEEELVSALAEAIVEVAGGDSDLLEGAAEILADA